MQIVRYPHPVLRFKSVDVTRIDSQLRQIVARMFELMHEARGIGLAANQVGLPFRLFVTCVGDDRDTPGVEQVYINPVLRKPKGFIDGEEGCLSLPELYADVERSAEITVEAFDLKGERFEQRLKGLPARCVQHEYDHIEGVLFTDHVSEKALAGFQEKLDQFIQEHLAVQEAGKLAKDDAIMKQLQQMTREGKPEVELP
jgi:peptide deformylase